MFTIIPNLTWYTKISQEKGLNPRCPYASVYRCPRFYQSLSLLGSAGSTSIDSVTDKKLFKKWKKTDIWPVTGEYETAIAGNPPKYFSNFCPEVSFDRFGFFATYLGEYADGIDRDIAHSNLANELVPTNHWRWIWNSIIKMHYSECPFFSLLNKDHNGSNEEIVELRPNFYGIGINFKILFKRLLKLIR